MDIKELKQKSESDLHNLLMQKRESLRELRFKDASKQLKDVREIRVIKKDIAQILTLLNKSKSQQVKDTIDASTNDKVKA